MPDNAVDNAGQCDQPRIDGVVVLALVQSEDVSCANCRIDITVSSSISALIHQRKVEAFGQFMEVEEIVARDNVSEQVLPTT